MYLVLFLSEREGGKERIVSVPVRFDISILENLIDLTCYIHPNWPTGRKKKILVFSLSLSLSKFFFNLLIVTKAWVDGILGD